MIWGFVFSSLRFYENVMIEKFQMNFEALKQELPLVELRTEDNGSISAMYQGVWVGVPDHEVLQMLRNYNKFLLKNGNQDFAETYKGYRLLVLSSGEMFVSRSKSECLKLKELDQYAFIGLVGFDPNDQSLRTIVTL